MFLYVQENWSYQHCEATPYVGVGSTLFMPLKMSWGTKGLGQKIKTIKSKWIVSVSPLNKISCFGIKMKIKLKLKTKRWIKLFSNVVYYKDHLSPCLYNIATDHILNELSEQSLADRYWWTFTENRSWFMRNLFVIWALCCSIGFLFGIISH